MPSIKPRHLNSVWLGHASIRHIPINRTRKARKKPLLNCRIGRSRKCLSPLPVRIGKKILGTTEGQYILEVLSGDSRPTRRPCSRFLKSVEPGGDLTSLG